MEKQYKVAAVAGSLAVAEEILTVVGQLFGQGMVGQPLLLGGTIEADAADLFLCFDTRFAELAAQIPAEKILGIEMVPSQDSCVKIAKLPRDEPRLVFCNKRRSAQGIIDYSKRYGGLEEEFSLATYEDMSEEVLIEALRGAKYIIGVSSLVSEGKLLPERFGQYLRPDCQIIAVERMLTISSVAALNQWLMKLNRQLEQGIQEKNDALSNILLKMSEEITKRTRIQKQLETILAHRSQQVTEILDSISDSVFAIDYDWKIRYANKAVAALCQVSQKKMEGAGLFSFFPRESVIIEPIAKCIAEQKATQEEVFCDTLNLWLEVICHPSAAGILVDLKDISEKKMLETEMHQLYRLKVVGEMAAGISHEVRNPITTVRGYLQFLSLKPAFTEVKDQLMLMISEIDRATHIINEFLSLSKPMPPKLQDQNLNKVLEKLKPLLDAEAIQKSCDIVFELGDIPDVILNESEIRQLIINLVINGLQAMDSGHMVISTSVTDTRIILAVKDSGHGIPANLHEHIGTPFFSTKQDGTGLGLTNCYAIAKRHNAAMDFISSKAGTTFFVKFPLPASPERKE
ncbi:MAG: ATP-binding protein [Negativicutes bacterium]|nr:ATP-binding protein [Negativicutes bacterium]